MQKNWVLLLLIFLWCHSFLPVLARTAAAPWGTDSAGFQNLVYGSSSPIDVQAILGPADEVVKTTQMFPVVENYLYYDNEEKTGAATLFVFENGLLVGMHHRSPDNQLMDLTYFLQNNGDRALNAPMLGGYFPYYPYFPLATW